MAALSRRIMQIVNFMLDTGPSACHVTPSGPQNQAIREKKYSNLEYSLVFFGKMW